MQRKKEPSHLPPGVFELIKDIGTDVMSEKRKSVTMEWESLSMFDQLSSLADSHSKKHHSTIIKQSEILSHLVFFQSLFVRLSWHEKNFVLTSLLKSVANTDVLSVVQCVLGSLFTKDVLFVLSQNVHAHSFDKIPFDDHRSLRENSTLDFLCQKTLWFVDNEDELQEKIFTGLIKCAGGPSIRAVFVEILKILTIPKFTWPLNVNTASPLYYVPSVLPGYLPYSFKRPSYRTTKQMSATSGSTANPKHPTFNLINDVSTTVVAGSKTGSLLTSSDIFDSGSGSFVTNINTWKQELGSLREKVISSILQSGNAVLIPQSESCDKLQMFPSYIVEKIISYLDANSRNELKKVSPYWAFIVGEVTKEEEARQVLKKTISALKAKYSEVVEEIEVDTKNKGQKKDKSKKEEKRKEGKTANKKSILEVAEETVEKPAVFEEPQIPLNEKKYIMEKFKNHPLNGKYSVVAISDQYRHNRFTVCTSDGKFLVTTSKSHTMVTHSLITGCQLATKLVGHTGPITCLILHPDGSHIVTGSVDATVRYWNFKHRLQEHIYIGHTKTITAVGVNSNYVASASYDNIIRVHNIMSTIIVWSFENQSGIISALFLTEDDRIFSGCATGSIKKYNLAKKKFISEFSSGHHVGEVKLLLVSPCLPHLVISAGADGLLNCFNIFELQAKPVISCSHGSAVTGVAVLCTSYLITGCEDGRLRIWNSSVGLLLRVIRPSADLRPIRNVHYYNTSREKKVVVNLDTGIFVFEFDFPQLVTKKKDLLARKIHTPSKSKSVNELVLPSINNPNKESSLSSRLIRKCLWESCNDKSRIHHNTENRAKYRKGLPSCRTLYRCCKVTKINPNEEDGDELRVNDFQSLTQKEKRMKSLDKRCCTLPKIRDRSTYAGSNTKDSVLLMALHKHPKAAAQVTPLTPQSPPSYSENT